MSKLDGITKGTRVETTGTALCFEDGVGLHGTVLKTTDTHAYVNLDGRPNTDRRTIDGVDTACTVYFWPYLKALPEIAIVIGDTVKVLEASTSWSHMKGVVGEVLDVTSNSGSILVKDPTGKGMWPREGGLGWWLSRHEVEKVEAKIALKAGDTVRVIKDGGFTSAGTPSVGDILEVTKVSHSGDLVYTTSGYNYWYGHESFADEIAPEPLANWERELLSFPFITKAEPRKLQVGDTVRFLENGLRTTVGSTGKITEVHGPHYTYRYRVTSGSQANARGSLYQANEIEYIEETIKQEETAVNQDFKTGDIVEAIESASGVSKGKHYTVKSVDNEYAGQRLVRTVNGPAAYAFRFKLVPAEKVVFKVGDSVKVLRKSYYITDRYVGQTGTVSSVEGTESVELLTSDGRNYSFSIDSLELVTEKAKTSSTEIKSHEIQKGDLIVCFWNEGGVETGRKGIAHENDGDDDWSTEEGEYLTYDGDANNCSASHIYLINRPEPKPAPKPEDALDKAKTYVDNYKKADGSKLAAYYLKHVGGAWRYSTTPEVDDSEDTIEGQVRHLIEGETLWEKPVEYIAPPKTVQEQLDDLGVKATDLYYSEGARLYYQFIGEGKARHTLGTTGIERAARASDVRNIKDGTFKKAN